MRLEGTKEDERADAAGIFSVENLGHMWVCSALLFLYGMQFHQLYKSHKIETCLDEGTTKESFKMARVAFRFM